MNTPNAKEATMVIRNSIGIAAMLTVTLVASIVHADSFEQLSSTGSAGSIHEAAGAFVPVFDEDGTRTEERVFLLHGGYPPELDADPSSDIWVLAEGSWQHLGNHAPAMASHALAAAADGRAWAVGAIGADGWNLPMSTLTTFEVRRIHGQLEVLVDAVHVPGPSPNSCFGASSVAVDGGRSILSVGGDCLGNPLAPDASELWEYRIDANRWYRRADLPVDISDHSAVSTDDSVWVFGGTGSGHQSNEVYRYDLSNDIWSLVNTTGRRPDPRGRHRSVVVGNSMLIFGGLDESSFPSRTMNDVWQLHLDRLSWTKKTSLPTGLAGMALDAIPPGRTNSSMEQVLIYGGLVDAWSFPNTISEQTLVYSSDVADTRNTFAIPAVARVRGAGAVFTSTIHMFNAGDVKLELALTFIPRQGSAGRVTTVDHTVLPGVMQTIDDPLTSVFGFSQGADRVGSLLIDVVEGSSNNLMVQTVVSARLDSGEECGQFFPAMGEAQTVRSDKPAHLNTTEDPTANRVNVGLMGFADDTRVIVTPMDPLGMALAPGKSFEFDIGGNAQINDIHDTFGLTATPNVMIEIRVNSGKVLAYASVLDGNGNYIGTSDPTTILPVFAGSEQVTLLEIGSISGTHEFSGSASITNHSDFPAEVNADFFQRGVPGITASRRLTIDAGSTSGFTDLAGDLFGVNGDVGTVVFRSLNAAQISATGREFAYFRDASGRQVGTAGQLIPGATEGNCLTPEREWHFVGLAQSVSQDDGERSHLAVFNPNTDDVEVTVTLFDGGTGKSEGSRSWTVRGSELIQINNVIARISRGHDDREKRIEVEVSRPVHMNAFRVNGWGDPVTLHALSR